MHLALTLAESADTAHKISSFMENAGCAQIDSEQLGVEEVSRVGSVMIVSEVVAKRLRLAQICWL